jgi:hypothetical protein
VWLRRPKSPGWLGNASLVLPLRLKQQSHEGNASPGRMRSRDCRSAPPLRPTRRRLYATTDIFQSTPSPDGLARKQPLCPSQLLASNPFDETRLLILGTQILLGFHLNGAFHAEFADMSTVARAFHAAARWPQRNFNCLPPLIELLGSRQHSYRASQHPLQIFP